MYLSSAQTVCSEITDKQTVLHLFKDCAHLYRLSDWNGTAQLSLVCYTVDAEILLKSVLENWNYTEVILQFTAITKSFKLSKTL